MVDDYSCGKFEHCLESHREADIKFGCTAYYNMHPEIQMSDSLSHQEFVELLPFIPPELADETGVNQHYMHSLEQFYAIVQKEWDAHVKRTNALIGTPMGRKHGRQL